ncbi:hypothetical protein PspLS_11552 [Pyricularia sp. CBS 133598]|nr:hypothetical protein PspLS_11552 [Pyricularia sp. CBS 133598]
MKSFLLLALQILSAVATPAPASTPDAYERELHTNLTQMLKRTDAAGGNKKGAAYNNRASAEELHRFGAASWGYNWKTEQGALSFEQVPMFWGPYNNATPVLDAIDRKRANVRWVMGYNEPDEVTGNGGCQQSPSDAYRHWGGNMFPFADRGVKIVCPAITSFNTNVGHAGYPAGLAWLRQWARLKGNPREFRCSAQALHWYGPAGGGVSGRQQAKLFIDYISFAHQEVNAIFGWDMPLWITEFAPLPRGDPRLLADFLAEVVPWMNRQPWIHRYSPFMAESMFTNGVLNAAGGVFKDVR